MRLKVEIYSREKPYSQNLVQGSVLYLFTNSAFFSLFYHSNKQYLDEEEGFRRFREAERATCLRIYFLESLLPLTVEIISKKEAAFLKSI